MKRILILVISFLAISSMSFAQDRDGRRDRNRTPDRGRGPGRGGPAYQDYSGAIGPGDYCSTCAFENRNDVPRTGKRSSPDRYLVNNDRDSIDARCQELGWDYGQALQWFTYREWCRYGNARTRTWDRYRRDWTFGRCVDGNVKAARCFRD